MEEYIKSLQEYLNENYGDSFECAIGKKRFELVVLHKNDQEEVMVIKEFEYNEEDFVIYLLEKTPFEFIEGIIGCLKDFRKLEEMNAKKTMEKGV